MGLNEDLRAWWESLPPWGKAVAASAVGIALYVPVAFFSSRPRKSPLKEDYKRDVVYLYQTPRTKFIPSMSCYCLKLETWLRMAEVNYENVSTEFGVTSKEGTIPFVELNGEEFDDSTFIIRDLSQRLNKNTLEESLNDEQKAASHAFEKLAEFSLYNSFQLFRAENVSALTTAIPPQSFGLLSPLYILYYKQFYPAKIISTLYAIGIGRHSREEQIRIGCDDIRAIAAYLGSKHYLMGFKPTKVDAALFGVLSQILYAPFESQHRQVIQEECRNVRDYVERMKARYWPDWDELTTQFTLNSNWKKKRTESPRRLK